MLTTRSSQLASPFSLKKKNICQFFNSTWKVKHIVFIVEE